MPKKFKLYWDKNNKYWFKKFDGKKVYFGKGKSKYLDKESYQKALIKYEEFLYERARTQATQERVSNVRLDSKWQRPVDTLAGAIDRYYEFHSRRQSRGEIGFYRLATIKTNFLHFEKFLGTGKKTKTYAKDGIKKFLTTDRMLGYFKRLERLVENREYTQGSAHTKWCTSKDFLLFCYERGWIDEMPRGLRRYKFNQYAKHSGESYEIETYSVKHVREMFATARDKVRQPLDLYMALALNFGFTSIDISTFKEENLIWNDERTRILRVRKERTKTGQIGEWKVWSATDFLIRDFFKRRALETSLGFGVNNAAPSPWLFRRRDGQELNQRKKRLEEGEVAPQMVREKISSNDSIGRMFYRFMKKNYPERPNLGFKNFRKCGASELVKLQLNNSLLLEQLYLNHKPQNVARQFYTRIETDTLDDALDALEKVYNLDELVIPYEEKRRGLELKVKLNKKKQRALKKLMKKQAKK